MSEPKTKHHDANVAEFIQSFASTAQKRTDSHALCVLMQEETGCEPKMWGPSIIGFGMYHYRSERSRQEGDWPVVGFSPRKAAISLYVYSGTPEQDRLLKTLGKFKMGKACIYVNKLADIDTGVLRRMIRESIAYVKAKYP